MKKIKKHLKEEWWKYGLETIVVVVGILMAFALNNWNENNKTEKLELQFLDKLQHDLAKDTLYYIDLISLGVSSPKLCFEKKS